MLDANAREWLMPPLSWGDVRRINTVLRQGGEALSLPRGDNGQPLCDLHHPHVQQWFHLWSPAAIVIGAVLLSEQSKGLSEEEFARCWRGEACDLLRQAIWKEWLEYLPPTAREPAEELRQSLQAQRAVQSQTLLRMIDVMTTQGQLIVDREIEALMQKLKGVPTCLMTASNGLPSSVSTHAPGAIANSAPCTTPGSTTAGTSAAGRPPRSAARGSKTPKAARASTPGSEPNAAPG